MDHNTLLDDLDFNESFKIHTNVRYFQLGVVIIKKGKLIDFYSRRITDAYKRYTVILKELLSIVETLK